MKALEVANYLLYVMSDICNDVSNLKMQKILYYAQGHYLQETGKPLFSDEIEAWPYGPVIPEVFHKFKTFKDTAISEWDSDKAREMPDEQRDFLIKVAREYCNYIPWELAEMTHKRNGPWDIIFNDNTRGNVIPVDVIKKHFITNEKHLQDIDVQFSESDYVGYHDTDGVFTIPEVWE